MEFLVVVYSIKQPFLDVLGPLGLIDDQLEYYFEKPGEEIEDDFVVVVREGSNGPLIYRELSFGARLMKDFAVVLLY